MAAATPTASASGTFQLGDLTVNRLGFGAMRVTGDGIWGPPNDRDEALRVLRTAVHELEVTLVDTADAYGPAVSEELIAEALHPYSEELVIATKGGLERPGPSTWRRNGRPEHLRAACEGSLRRLRLERIDVYQLHAPDEHVPLEDSLGELTRLHDEGKIRHIGVSNFTVDQLERAVEVTPVVSVQNRYNLDDRGSEPVLRWCEERRVGFIPWRPLGGGGLDAAAAADVARKHHARPTQIGLAWLLRRSPVMLPIPGTSSVAHLRQNVGAAGIRLSDEEMDRLDGSA